MTTVIRFWARWLLLGAVSLGLSVLPRAQTLPPEFNTIRALAVDSLARETGEDTGFAFRFTRLGAIDHPVNVFYALEGTAQDRLDYQGPLDAAGQPPLDAIPGPLHLVTIPAGRESVDLQFRALPDDLVEPAESVVARVIASPIASAPTPENSYNIAPEEPAKAIIENTTVSDRAQLTLIKPLPEARFTAPATVEFAATAVDPKGAIYRVEFFAGDQLVAVSELATLVAIPPGTPVQHGAVWQNAPAGRHELRAKARDSLGNEIVSTVVPIVVGEPVELPVVAVIAKDGTAAEADAADIGIFQISRTGDVTLPLTVLFSVRGSAERSVDYVLIPESMFIPCPDCLRPEVILTGNSIEIPAGEHSVLIGVRGIPDKAIEGTEGVVLKLEPPPVPAIVGAKPPYWVGQPAEARVNVVEGIVLGPTLVIHSPEAGAVFTAPADIGIRLTAHDPAGLLGGITLWANGQKLGEAQFCAPEARCLPPTPGQPVLHSFQWNEVPAGDYELVAMAKTANGTEVKSAAVRITVKPATEEARLVITTPKDGAEFGAPARILITLSGFDPAGYFESVTLFANDTKLGDAQFCLPNADCPAPAAGTPSLHSFAWANVAAGEYHLTALGKSTSGKEVKSAAVRVLVVGDDATRVTLVAKGSDWSYLDTGVAPNAGWTGPDFDAALWKTGPAELGYGDGDEATAVGFGPDPKNKFITTWFRRTFNVEDPTALKVLHLRLRRDDGASVYLNGVEVLRSNLPDGAITPTTLALSALGDDQEDEFLTVEVPLSALKAGQNVIAAEVHQANVTSSDISFDLALVASTVVPPPAARIVFKSPAPGSEFTAPATVPLKVEAVDPSGHILHVDFYAGDRKIGESTLAFKPPAEPGTPLEHVFDWINVPAGEYRLWAAGETSGGQRVVSDSVRVLVRKAPAASVVLTSPKAGDVFQAPATVVFKAVAIDPDSYIPHVSFYANERKVGESSLLFLQPPAPGSPIEHEFQWKEVPAGQYLLYAVGKSADGTEVKGAPVRITVLGDAVIPAVTIEAVEPETSEPRGRELSRPAVFALRRTGPADRPLQVFYGVGGTATNGKDYARLDGDATFAVGEHVRHLLVWPLHDSEIESRESVVLELKDDLHYVAAEPRRAEVRILDTDTPDHPYLVITEPHAGAAFAVGASVEIRARAVDPLGYLPTVEFTANGAVIGTSQINFLVAPPAGTPIEHSLVWKPEAPGEVTLGVRTTTAAGLKVESAPVKVLITRPSPTPFATRELPDFFVPGTAFTVTLRTTPPAETKSFGLEDQPPRGWAVGEISAGGAFDATTGKVKFGPFFDADPRTLTYQVTPPAVTEHIRHEFDGIASADGANARIGGDRLVTAQLNHPADRTPADFRMTLAEVTAYGAAWKSGAEWVLPPNPVPVDYVTRAGALWKGGEAYQFDPAAGKAPLWWINVPVAESQATAEAEEGVHDAHAGPHRRSVAVAEYIVPLDPALPVEVLIRVRPVASVLNFAIEERLPFAGAVSEISDEGVYDEGAGVIRWGPFFSAEPKTLRFLIKPGSPLPAGNAQVSNRPGVASFDGKGRVLHRHFRPVGPRPRPEIVDSTTLVDGSVQLMVLDDAGEPASVLEVSTDLNAWREVGSFEASGETGFSLDLDANETVVRFYRAKRRAP